jgi:uncharacterized pyridoxal phosphate-containing UPF0001 family protein
VVDLIHGLQAAEVRAALGRVRERIEAAGRRAQDVQILVAVKYLAAAELPVLAEAGITLQSRKVALLLPHVRYLQTVASDTAAAQLARHGGPGTRVMIEVNVAGEPGKAGIAPTDLQAFIERCPVPVVGLMTMAPLCSVPEDNRPYFRALRELAEQHRLTELSMGTSQDYEAAVAEGATIIRLGSTLLRPSAP